MVTIKVLWWEDCWLWWVVGHWNSEQPSHIADTAFESSCIVNATEIYTELRKILYILSSLHRAGLCSAGQIRLYKNL